MSEVADKVIRRSVPAWRGDELAILESEDRWMRRRARCPVGCLVRFRGTHEAEGRTIEASTLGVVGAFRRGYADVHELHDPATGKVGPIIAKKVPFGDLRVVE